MIDVLTYRCFTQTLGSILYHAVYGPYFSDSEKMEIPCRVGASRASCMQGHDLFKCLLTEACITDILKERSKKKRKNVCEKVRVSAA